MLETAPIALPILVFAYLTGSLNSAIILCRLSGLPDPRSQGSGNPGATNVLRFGGKKLAAIVLIIDILKGVLPVLVARLFDLSEFWLMATAFSAFIGHLYPILFQFKGGKGVATALGGLLSLSPVLALVILATWLLVFAISRISSLSAISAALVAPILSLWFFADPLSCWLVLFMTALLLIRHSENIKRLIRRQEGKS